MPQETTASPIGRDTPRVDGPLKVTGTAHYASDFHFPGLLYGVPVEATIANGKITKLDTVFKIFDSRETAMSYLTENVA